jgi:hypothetical protein
MSFQAKEIASSLLVPDHNRINDQLEIRGIPNQPFEPRWAT